MCKSAKRDAKYPCNAEMTCAERKRPALHGDISGADGTFFVRLFNFNTLYGNSQEKNEPRAHPTRAEAAVRYLFSGLAENHFVRGKTMKTKRVGKILSMILALVMLAATMPLGVSADEREDVWPNKGYLSDISLTTNVAEVCRTGNYAVNPKYFDIECTPEGVLDKAKVYYSWCRVDENGEVEYYLWENHMFEKDETYRLELTIYSPGWSGNDYYGFKDCTVKVDGTECSAFSRDVSSGYDDLYRYTVTNDCKLLIYIDITTNEDYPLRGKVSYSGEAVWGETLYATDIELTTEGVPTYSLKPQWQVKEDGEWVDIEGENYFSIKLQGESKRELVGKKIRVSYTADGYRALYGDSKTVQKRDASRITAPEAPKLVTYDHGNSVKIYIENYNPVEQVYYSSIGYSGNSAMSTPVEVTDEAVTIEKNSQDQIVEISTKVKTTPWQDAGLKMSQSRTIVPALSSGNAARTLIYPEYNTLTPTVYVPIGGTVGVKYMIGPADATGNLPRWVSGSLASVTMGKAEDQGDGEGLVVIRAGDKAGTEFVTAYKPNENTPWYYGQDYSSAGRQITVIIYDPADISSIPTAQISKTIELPEGETYEADIQDLREYPFAPIELGVNIDPDLYDYDIAIYKSTLQGYEWIERNDYISVGRTEEGGVRISAEKSSDAVSQVTVFAVSKEDGTRRELEKIYVKVVSNGVNVSGSITSYGDENDEITVRFVLNGDPAHEQVLTGNSASYSVDHVASDSYTVTVSKKAHVTGVYDVTVGTEDIVRDIVLIQYGDADENGQVNIADAVAVLKYVAKWNIEPNINACDVDVNGEVSLSDAVKILKKIAGWDVTLGES